jgi:predicted NBD/HSP70 family sugar kinase
LSWQKVDHVGIGHPGDLDHERGVCASWAIAPGWSGVPLRKHFEEVFRMHVYIDDISRAVALAERHTSLQDWSHPDAIYIQTGTGIGMGTFIDGRLYRGSTRGGGEIGHTVIDLAGPLCKCGNRGCVEAIASTGSIVRQVSESIEAGQSSSLSTLAAPITIEQVLEHAHRGDQLARTVLARAYDALGIGIANAIQILNPSLVVLCGRLARLAGDDLLEVVVRNVKRQCVATASRQVAVRVAKPKKDISTVGCALIAAEAQAQRVVRMRLSGTTGTTA